MSQTLSVQISLIMFCFIQALNYAKNVPKPKPMASRKRENSGSGRHWEETRGDEDQEITVLEILRMRHEKEKQEVDSIRKDLASKIRL